MKQDELSKKSPELVEKQRGLELLVDQLEIQKGQISKQIELVLQIENEIVYQLNEAKSVQHECDKRMKEAAPVFKNAVEGLLQITKKEIDERKKALIDAQIKIYNEGIKDNDPRFNLVGGTFKGAITVKSNMHTLALPD